MQYFNSLLVANRGEIAVRIMRSARAMGLRTIAVYSDADAGAPHVAMADDAVLIGPAPVGESYLDAERILAAARETGAEAVHPGYGFLSENADFARACAAAGLVFVGPSADAIELMGDKSAAKTRMIAAGVPCVPGYEGTDQNESAMVAAAAEIGFPVMVKASAGGGGRGMRLVESADALPDALAAARSEAANAFGSGHLILEKAIVEPRHVELQVFADDHGAVIHLGERDCSVQRRHQKVVEEAPCPVMTDVLRTAMGEAAVEAARSIGYRGAGTVEFLLDPDGAFYFLEMNTRLQVEHPVTEMVTGLDLVAMQIEVARGLPLVLEQADVAINGHAMEVRLYAEDPSRDFLPCTGEVAVWRPTTGADVRIDAGIVEEEQISPFYDPMMAKVIAWGETRDSARQRLITALCETRVFGLTTNRAFLVSILSHPMFAAGRATTHFIASQSAELDLAEATESPVHTAIAAVLLYIQGRDEAHARSIGVSPLLLNWSSAGTLWSAYRLDADGSEIDLVVRPTSVMDYRVRGDEIDTEISLLSQADGRVCLTVDGRRRTLDYAYLAPGALQLAENGRTHAFSDYAMGVGIEDAAAGGGQVVAPMHGVLLEICVGVGDDISKGDRLAVVEAMKMHQELLAEVDGTIRQISASVGTQVAAGDLLIEIDTGEEAEADRAAG